MPKSTNSLLKMFWENLETDEYITLDYDLSIEDLSLMQNVLTERHVRCALCGRADFQNANYRFTFLRKKPLTIQAYCPCGNRVAAISRASAFKRKTQRPKLPITLVDFLELIEKNRNNNGDKK